MWLNVNLTMGPGVLTQLWTTTAVPYGPRMWEAQLSLKGQLVSDEPEQGSRAKWGETQTEPGSCQLAPPGTHGRPGCSSVKRQRWTRSLCGRDGEGQTQGHSVTMSEHRHKDRHTVETMK